jgi:hypothetical protein
MKADGTPVAWHDPCHDIEECALARAIWTDDSGYKPGLEVKCKAVESHYSGVVLGNGFGSKCHVGLAAPVGLLGASRGGRL